MAQIIHEKRFDAVDHRAHARSMNLQSQLVPAGYDDIGALFVAAGNCSRETAKLARCTKVISYLRYCGLPVERPPWSFLCVRPTYRD